MIVWFVLILSIVWVSLATALYANFLPYLALLGDIKNYNMAYYGANTAIERSLSVLRYQEAWFEWTGWWNKSLLDPNIPDSPVSDQWWFWYYDTSDTTIQRTITSRSDWNAIPGTGKWNTDNYFLSGWSNDRNKLDYRNPQKIPLWVDSTPSASAYSWDMDRSDFTGQDIVLNLQLIPFVKEKFGGTSTYEWKLNDENDVDGDGVANDIIVDRWWKWLYGTSSEFSIIPRSLVWSSLVNPDIVPLSDDESIREDSINTLSSTTPVSPITFWGNFNPLYSVLRSTQRGSHLIISDNTDELNTLSLKTFNDLLLDANITSQELNFFLTKPLVSKGSNIYPFLQYNISFVGGSSPIISQPYFTINGKSQVWEYTVQMNVKKSINKNETLWSFTVVF